MTSPDLFGNIHICIGDTQAKKGVPDRHMTWIGRYIVDKYAGKIPANRVKIIGLGDHADMPSLSGYDKGKKSMEGRRIIEDIRACRTSWSKLNKPLWKYNLGRLDPWDPDKFVLEGNHEDRIRRACEDDAQLDGLISIDDLNYKEWGWKVIPFLEVLWLDGVAYSHYFYNPTTGRPYGGENLLPRLKTIGHSFTMGHQQGRRFADRAVGQKTHRGLVLGSTYLHDEKYIGPQGNKYWRGIVICHQVKDGDYDLMEVSLDYLCRRYERKTLKDWMKDWNRKNGPDSLH